MAEHSAGKQCGGPSREGQGGKPKRMTKAEQRASAKAEDERCLAALPEPGTRTKAAIERAKQRHADRPHRVQLTGYHSEGKLKVMPEHADDTGWLAQIRNATGTTSEAFTNRCLQQLTTVTRSVQQPQTIEDMNVGLAVLDGVQPRDEVEAMLASQMVATHDVAMHMLAKAKHADYLEHMNSFGGLATKLLRTFTPQTWALAMLLAWW